MAESYKKKVRPRLKIFGISLKTLKDYCTSEKDLVEKIDRMPSDDFILDDLNSGGIDSRMPSHISNIESNKSGFGEID